MKNTSDHARSISESFSNLSEYQRKLEESSDGLWGGRYPEHMELYARLYRHRNLDVSSKVSGGKRLLDIGCGLGDVLALLADNYRELYGIDPTENYCEKARQNLCAHDSTHVKIDVGVCEQLNYPDNYFDTVTLLDVYEHVETAWRPVALREIHRVLRPGGELVLSTPSRRIMRLWNLFDNILTLPSQLRHQTQVQLWAFRKKNHYEEFTTRSQLLVSLRQAGFKIMDFRRIGFFPAPERTGFLDRWLPKIYAHPRLQRIFCCGFTLLESARFLNQKMNVRAVKA
ncbi:MAG: class I SAM-dependent methyltransferase [Luteolibacter sp.]